MEHIDNTLLKMRKIFERVHANIDKLKPGEKILATALSETLAKEMGYPSGAAIYPFLKIFLVGYPGIDCRRGKYGGIYKL